MNRTLAILFVIVAVLGVTTYLAFNDNPSLSVSKTRPAYISSPDLEKPVSSPMHIDGRAKGYWFFEASFPIFIVDWDGRIIAQGIAKAKGDWMTEDYVPFEANITFEKPSYGDRGSIILKKDNPSGLPENDGAVELPIIFK